MGKLSEIFKSVVDKAKALSSTKKIAFIVLFLVGIVALVLFANYMQSNKYGVLFANLDPEDSRIVVEKLKESKVDTQIKGNTIYVPKAQVDILRLEFASSLTNGSSGYELLDSGSKFGMTDEEFRIKIQRATQGELERTIKSFPQVENARVHLTLPQDSPFVRDRRPGTAAVYLQLKTGTKLSADQVRTIANLISGSVGNIPKENVSIVDQNMNHLSEGVFEEENNVLPSSLANQKSIEAEFEKKLEKALRDMLEPVIGRDKVRVTVNADLDFDAKEKTEIIYDPNKVEVSTHTIKEENTAPGEQIAQSPIDNNMNNTVPANNAGNSTSLREEEIRNYNVGKTETRVISAPGEVKRLTASVIIDGRLDEVTRNELERAVAAAIGSRPDRGDEISIIGMNFDTAARDAEKAMRDAIEAQAAKERRMSLIMTGVYAGIGLIAFIIFMIILRRTFKKKEEVAQAGIDVVIGDEIAPKDKIQYAPLELEVEDEKTHVEKEIKKYATEKPEQVAEIVKSWLAEDER